MIVSKDKDYKEINLHISKGNLIGLRSWAYFTLVRLFGEAAYIPDNMVSLPNNLKLEYINRVDMLDTLENHLLPYLDIDYLDELTIMYNKALIGEIYLEKAFDIKGLRPRVYMQVARELGDTSLMFMVHPTLSAEDISNMSYAVSKVLEQASR